MSGIKTLLPSVTAFAPVSVVLDMEANGTRRGIMVTTSEGKLVYCNFLATVCTLLESEASALAGLGIAWDSNHRVSQYFISSPAGAATYNMETRSSTNFGSWRLVRSFFFVVDTESATSDIIACTYRGRVERCPQKEGGQPSDCSSLVSGACTGIAAEYGADGAMVGFVAAFENRVESCLIDGTNCQVIDGDVAGEAGAGLEELNSPQGVAVERAGTRGQTLAYWIIDDGNKRIKRCPLDGKCQVRANMGGSAIALDPIATQEEVIPPTSSEGTAAGSIRVGLEATVSDQQSFETSMTPAGETEAWFAMEESFAVLTSLSGWTLESYAVIETGSERRLTSGVTYSFTFANNWVDKQDVVIPSKSAILAGLEGGFSDTANAEVHSAAWSFTAAAVQDITYTDAAEDDDAEEEDDFSTVDTTSITTTTASRRRRASTTTKIPWEYEDSSLQISAPGWVLLLFGLLIVAGR